MKNGLYGAYTHCADNSPLSQGGIREEMDTDFQTLIVLAEVLVAFVGFSAIVSSIKLTMGRDLSPFQRLLIHFFIESGMLGTFIALLPMVLWSFLPDERLVTQISGTITVVLAASYLAWYLRRRIAIKAPTPIISAAIILGWFLWIPILAVGMSGYLWEPKLAFLEVTAFGVLIGSSAIFVTFLRSFLDVEDDS